MESYVLISSSHCQHPWLFLNCSAATVAVNVKTINVAVLPINIIALTPVDAGKRSVENTTELKRESSAAEGSDYKTNNELDNDDSDE